MTEQSNPDAPKVSEKFTVDEWVDFYEGEWHTVARVIDVTASEVTVCVDRDARNPMKFAPRASDGRYVRLLPNEPVRDHEVMPTMIFHGKMSERLNAAITEAKVKNEKKASRRSFRDFLRGLFSGS